MTITDFGDKANLNISETEAYNRIKKHGNL